MVMVMVRVCVCVCVCVYMHCNSLYRRHIQGRFTNYSTDTRDKRT